MCGGIGRSAYRGQHFGLPIIYYSDNGGGQTGKTIDHEITGITSRLGIRHETGIAGNPQGRGIIERWWKDNLIEMARQYETFAGSGDGQQHEEPDVPQDGKCF